MLCVPVLLLRAFLLCLLCWLPLCASHHSQSQSPACAKRGWTLKRTERFLRADGG